MNPYEGLNLVDLLELLHAPVMAEPVSWVPQTIGWQVVGVWLGILAVLGAWHAFQYWRRNRYRREALDALADIEAELDDAPGRTATEIGALVKRTALAVYPRAEVAHLYGADWAAFLCESAANDAEVTQSAGDIASAAYRTDIDPRSLIGPARRWIKVHRA